MSSKSSSSKGGKSKKPELDTVPTVFRCSISKVSARNLTHPTKKGVLQNPSAYFRFHFFNVKPFQSKVAKNNSNPVYKLEHEWLYRTLLPKKLATRKFTIEYKVSAGLSGQHVGVAVLDLLAVATGPVKLELELFSVSDASVSVGFVHFELVMEEFGFPLMSMELALTPTSKQASSSAVPPSFFCQATQLPESSTKLKGLPRHRSPTLAKLRAPFFVLDNVPFDNASYKGLLSSRVHLQLLSKSPKDRKHALFGAYAVVPLAELLTLKKNETVDTSFDLLSREGVKVAEARGKVNWAFLPRMVQMIGGMYNSRTGITGGRIVAHAVAPRLRGYEIPVHRPDPEPVLKAKTNANANANPNSSDVKRSRSYVPSPSVAMADAASELEDEEPYEDEGEGDEGEGEGEDVAMVDTQQLPPLPPHWTRAYDERGQVYYIDTLSKRHQWTHPLMATLGSQRALLTLRGSKPPPTSATSAPPAHSASPFPPLASTHALTQSQSQSQSQAPARVPKPPLSTSRSGKVHQLAPPPAPMLSERKGSGFFAHFKPEAPPLELPANDVEAEDNDEGEDARRSSMASTEDEVLELEDDDVDKDKDKEKEKGSSDSKGSSTSDEDEDEDEDEEDDEGQEVKGGLRHGPEVDRNVEAALALLKSAPDLTPRSTPAPVSPTPVLTPALPLSVPLPAVAASASVSASASSGGAGGVSASYNGDGPFTVLVLGWSGVGRSAFMQRLLLGAHVQDTRYAGEGEERSPAFSYASASLGLELPLALRNPRVTPERPFDSLPELDSVHSVVLMYDLTDKDSFESLVAWWRATRRLDMPAVLVGNHLDERDDREVAARKVAQWSRQNDVTALECSVRTGENVETVMDTLVRAMVHTQRKAMRLKGLPLAHDTRYDEAPRETPGSASPSASATATVPVPAPTAAAASYDTSTVVVRDVAQPTLAAAASVPGSGSTGSPSSSMPNDSAQKLRSLFTPPPARSASLNAAASSAHPILAQNLEGSARPKPEINPYSPQQLDRHSKQ